MQKRDWRLGAILLSLTAATAGLSAGQLALRPAEDWIARLERPDRVASLKIDYIISSLGLKPGAVVADIGAGPGVLSLPSRKRLRRAERSTPRTSTRDSSTASSKRPPTAT